MSISESVIGNRKSEATAFHTGNSRNKLFEAVKGDYSAKSAVKRNIDKNCVKKKLYL